jgi:hypothetical protein
MRPPRGLRRTNDRTSHELFEWRHGGRGITQLDVSARKADDGTDESVVGALRPFEDRDHALVQRRARTPARLQHFDIGPRGHRKHHLNVIGSPGLPRDGFGAA